MKPGQDLETLRQYYAEELRAVANLQSETLVRAFAKVPRENFLGPGPWQVFSPGSETDWTTKDADPKHLYHNLLVVIDAERHLNNGLPSFLAFLLDELELHAGDRAVHVGCGTGYYTAIMAEVVGPDGRVTAIEIDPELAARARTNLEYLAHVEVIAGDGGGDLGVGPSDAILVNAGATHPSSVWLDSLRLGGRLLVPLTVVTRDDGSNYGFVLKVKRQNSGLSAGFTSRVSVFSCEGGRDEELNDRLKEAFEREDRKSVQSLRRDTHDPVDTCWFHADTFCLSKLAVA
jgi:protein-L-isoaspartate(D-aspartate) O-methyltransferase